MEKVSVIIPIYNSEQFLKLCVQSVSCQTYGELEILLIDDGSEDKSPEICRQLKEDDPRIRIIHQGHRGVSAARNRGLDVAEGKYVFFLDSDDAIHPCLIEKLVCQVEGFHLDLAFCNYRKTESRQMDESLNRMIEETGRNRGHERPDDWETRLVRSRVLQETELKWIVSDETRSETWFHIEHFHMLTGIGGKLIRKSTVDTLRFDEGLTNGEDTLFIYHLVSQKLSVTYTDAKWYFYRMHPKSLVHSPEAIEGSQSFQVYRTVRDMEYEKQHREFALAWERGLSRAMLHKFTLMRAQGKKEGCRLIKKQAAA